MSVTPLKITLYDPQTDEVKADYTRLFVPWKLLKKAVALSKQLTTAVDDFTEADVDLIAALVVETFGNRFTVDELNDGADIGQMMAVLTQIVAIAQGAIPRNPTLPQAR